jgi:antitoxin MazE
MMGNSQGIRIPKLLIEQTGISGDVMISVKGNTVIISPANPPRAGGADAFAAMAKRGDDRLVDGGASGASEGDGEEWGWWPVGSKSISSTSIRRWEAGPGRPGRVWSSHPTQ